MDRIELEKNCLDLAYQRRMQHQNAILVLITTGLLSFIGSFWWEEDKRKIGLIFAVCLFVISIIWYKKIDKDLHLISRQIKNLK